MSPTFLQENRESKGRAFRTTTAADLIANHGGGQVVKTMDPKEVDFVIRGNTENPYSSFNFCIQSGLKLTLSISASLPVDSVNWTHFMKMIIPDSLEPPQKLGVNRRESGSENRPVNQIL